ncbi:MAG: 1-deoxy-D-xylulose-5-phosphate reductoisomerase [Thermodesulfobacteriota bacterium]
MTKGVSILGSTGSIGRSTLEIVRRHPDRFRVVSLAAGTNVALLKKQVEEFRPEFVSVLNEKDAPEIGGGTEVGFGGEGVERAATHGGADVVVSAIVGSAGLLPTLAAIRAGKDIALANKETLVVAGKLVMEEVEKNGVRLLPVDSEHSAVFQALQGHRREDVRRIILTASGGPFLNRPIEGLRDVTPEEALKHPNWSMGERITVDSATLMNKGFEVMEASWLFDVPMEKIDVYIHPRSIVHSMVEYVDGSIMAQMGPADMKGPISYALAYPERIDDGGAPFDLSAAPLEFMQPEDERFPCLGLARKAMECGGTAPAVLNAADEAAVGMFLDGKIRFTEIFTTVAEVLDKHEPRAASSVEEVLKADRWAREAAGEIAASAPAVTVKT